jgi:mannose-6-phosphate isomerase-like protein (cupin superfamily)
VIEGKGVMTLGNIELPIQAGDWVVIPEGTPHRVKVTSKRPLKVLSIQSPQFDGTDRIILEKE